MEQVGTEDVERIARAVGERPFRIKWAPGHGAPSNRRYLVGCRDRSVFAKVAAFDYTADWLRREHDVYLALSGEEFLPRLVGWDDDGAHPVLVIEDLSGATWPPPWTSAGVAAVRSSLERVHDTAVPSGLGGAEEILEDIREGWNEVRADPEPLLRLGVCTGAWLTSHLDELETVADAAVIEGDALVHFDVRSDNLCIRDGSAVFVDWNWAARGDPVFDTASWLPSLAAEGGPEPWEMLSGHGEFASLLAGFFLAHAVRPSIPQAPHVRELQEVVGRVALLWAAHALSLPLPDGG